MRKLISIFMLQFYNKHDKLLIMDKIINFQKVDNNTKIKLHTFQHFIKNNTSRPSNYDLKNLSVFTPRYTSTRYCDY
jgi:hypothetical protein